MVFICGTGGRVPAQEVVREEQNPGGQGTGRRETANSTYFINQPIDFLTFLFGSNFYSTKTSPVHEELKNDLKNTPLETVDRDLKPTLSRRYKNVFVAHLEKKGGLDFEEEEDIFRLRSSNRPTREERTYTLQRSATIPDVETNWNTLKSRLHIKEQSVSGRFSINEETLRILRSKPRKAGKGAVEPDDIVWLPIALKPIRIAVERISRKRAGDYRFQSGTKIPEKELTGGKSIKFREEKVENKDPNADTKVSPPDGTHE